MSSQKTAMALCRASIISPFPNVHAGSCLVDRDAIPSDGSRPGNRESRGDREEKPVGRFS